MKKFKE